MSGNSFLSNFSYTLVLNLVIKLFWVLGIEVAVQNILGTAAYGTYFELFQFTFLFFIVLDLGLSNYNIRTLAGDQERLKELFNSMITIKMMLSLVYLVILLAAAWIMGYNALETGLVMFIGINQVLLSLMVYLRSNISALHLFKTDALLSVLDRLLMGLLCAVFIWVPFFKDQFSLYYFLLAQVAGYFIAVVIAFGAVLRRGISFNPVWNGTVFREMLKQSYPFAILFTLMSLYTRLDAVMLGRMLPQGDFHAGVYASAFRLLDASIIFAVLLSNLLLPMFSRMIKQGQKTDDLVKESFTLVLIASVILPLSFYFYSKPVYALLYKNNLEYGSTVFGLLFFNFIPMAMGYIFGTLLTAGSKLRLLNLISVAGLLVNVVLNLALIPSMQATGASIATVITQSLVTGVTFLFCVKHFHLNMSDFINFRVVSFVGLSIGLFFFISINATNWVLGMSLSVVFSACLAVVFRLIRPSEMMKAFQSKG